MSDPHVLYSGNSLNSLLSCFFCKNRFTGDRGFASSWAYCLYHSVFQPHCFPAIPIRYHQLHRISTYMKLSVWTLFESSSKRTFSNIKNREIITNHNHNIITMCAGVCFWCPTWSAGIVACIESTISRVVKRERTPSWASRPSLRESHQHLWSACNGMWSNHIESLSWTPPIMCLDSRFGMVLIIITHITYTHDSMQESESAHLNRSLQWCVHEELTLDSERKTSYPCTAYL